jgi:WhiB family transcriptional regulator, redox-sensing transcriptional regulator
LTTIATWRASAVCAGGDPAAFFDPDRSDEARGVCAGCPVRVPCLLEALESGDEGIWGGTDEEQRRAILAELAAVPTDTAGIGDQVAWLVRRQADRPIGVCPRCSGAFIDTTSVAGWCAHCTAQAAIEDDAEAEAGGRRKRRWWAG